MNDWRLILDNPLTRVRTYCRVEDDGGLVFRDVMAASDANSLADQTAEVRAENVYWRHRLRRSTQNHRVPIARLPAVIVNQLMRDGIWGDNKKLSAWFNDPSNKMWRVAGGYVKIRDR